MPTPIDDEMLQRLLERLAAGESAAVDELVAHSVDRFRLLARKMLRRHEGLRRWNATDDVLQNVALRLRRALPEVKPDTIERFVGLAATQIRRELIDLGRHHLGRAARPTAGTPESGDEPTPKNRPRDEPLDDDHQSPHTGPATMLQRQEIHELVGRLPDEERQVVELLIYQGLSHPSAAKELNVSEATVKRRFREARLRLHRLLTGAGSDDGP